MPVSLFRFLTRSVAFSVLTVSSLAATTAFVTPSHAAAPAPAAALYTWKTENAKDDKTGSLQHCLIKNAFDNGTLLILAENHEGLQRLAIHFPEDVLQPNILVDLTLQVDKQDVFPVEGITSTPRVLAMNVPQAFPDQLRKGNILRIRGPEDEIAYQLNGTDKAVQALRDCVVSHKNPSITRTKLAAISDADADLLAQQAKQRPHAPAEMMETAQAPVSAKAMQENLGLGNDKKADDTKAKPIAKTAVKPTEKPAAKKEAPKATKPSDTAMPAVPVAAVKSADIPQAAKTVQKTPAGELPTKWHYLFKDLALAPQGKTLDATKMRMTAPLQHAWLVDGLKVGLHNGQSVDVSVLEQSGKHYMFNMRRQCSGEFVAEADTVKITTNGKMHWQIAEVICADKKEERLSALLFTTTKDDTSTIVIEGPMQDATRIIRLRNDVLERLNR